jgi:hypothetical protein
MSVLVDWHAAAVYAAAIVALAGLTGLLWGACAMVRVCAVAGAGEIAVGAAVGNPIAIGCGIIIVAVAIWCLWYLRGGSA